MDNTKINTWQDDVLVAFSPPNEVFGVQDVTVNWWIQKSRQPASFSELMATFTISIRRNPNLLGHA